MDNEMNQPIQNSPGLSNSPKNNKKTFVFTIILLVITVATVAFGAAYIWQKSNNDKTVDELNEAKAKIAQIEAQQADETDSTEEEPQQDSKEEESSVSATNPDLIPGDTDTRRDDGRILISAVFKYSLKPTEVWVEYGKSPISLDSSTEKITQELGLGDPEEVYATGFGVAIDDSELEPGTVYYYRTVATVNGEIQRSSIASFVTDK